MKELKNNYWDAIFVLGVSTEPKFFKPRVDMAARLYWQGSAALIVFSGKWWGWLKKRPKTTEARLMMRYAVEKGVPRRAILLEERALNTAGNFYFTKKDILKPKSLKRLLVVTSLRHFPKAKYLAAKILGPNYTVKFIDDGQDIGAVAPGHAHLEEVHEYFAHIKDGDDQALRKLVKKDPHYRRYRNY